MVRTGVINISHGKFPKGLFSNHKKEDKKELYNTIEKELNQNKYSKLDVHEREKLCKELLESLDNNDINNIKDCLKEGATDFFEKLVNLYTDKLSKIELLIDLGADFNNININNDGLLSLLLKKDFKYGKEEEIKTRIVKKMIEKGCDVNKKNNGDDWTPIMYAARKNYKEIVDMLIENGADVHFKGGFRDINSKRYLTKWYLLNVEMHNEEMISAIEKEWLKKLLNENVNDKYIIDRGLICAIKHGSLDDVKKVFDMGADVNCALNNNKKYNANSRILVPLLVAIEFEKEDVIKFLIEKRAKLCLDIRRDDNNLMENVFTRVHREKMLEFAVNEYIEKINKEDINKLIGEQNTLLIYAAKFNFKDSVKKLIEKGVDLEIKVERTSHTTILDTALTMSIRKKHNEIAKMLIDAGANINEKYSQSESNALYVAIKEKNVEILEYLIEKNVKLNPGNFSENPLIDAINDEIENPIVELLIKRGADVNAVDELNQTALSAAISKEDYKTIDLLIKNDAKFIYEDDMGDEMDVMDEVNNTDLREYLEKIKKK